MSDEGGPVEPRIQITAYTVFALPEGLSTDSDLWSVKVEWRGKGRWAVTHFGDCLGDDGEWDREPFSSSREDDWLAHHRFDEQIALRLAQEAASTIKINGYTPADLLAKYSQSGRSTTPEPRRTE